MEFCSTLYLKAAYFLKTIWNIMCGNVVLYKLHPVLNTKLFVAIEISLLVSDTTTNSVLGISVSYLTKSDPHYILIIFLLWFKKV